MPKAKGEKKRLNPPLSAGGAFPSGITIVSCPAWETGNVVVVVVCRGGATEVSVNGKETDGIGFCGICAEIGFEAVCSASNGSCGDESIWTSGRSLLV